MSVNQLYPNSPTPNISVDSWDFDPGYDLTLHGDYVREPSIASNIDHSYHNSTKNTAHVCSNSSTISLCN